MECVDMMCLKKGEVDHLAEEILVPVPPPLPPPLALAFAPPLALAFAPVVVG